MATPVQLESPARPEDLYLATTQDDIELLAYRPRFTGDLLLLPDGDLVVLVQHPCAMRRGASLLPKLLACGTSQVTKAPSDWSTGNYKRMFLPDLPGGSLAIDFTDMRVLQSAEAASASPRAILSMTGVNLLVQRWLHHNSRVIVPTITIHEQTAGPFEEADLTGDMIADLILDGMNGDVAAEAVDTWMGKPGTDGGLSPRDMLVQSQSRSAVRSASRQYVRGITN